MKWKTASPPICVLCKYLEKHEHDKSSCKAYPEGIPEEIIENRVDHRFPYEGDHGIQFEESTRLKSKFMRRFGGQFGTVVPLGIRPPPKDKKWRRGVVISILGGCIISLVPIGFYAFWFGVYPSFQYDTWEELSLIFLAYLFFAVIGYGIMRYLFFSDRGKHK